MEWILAGLAIVVLAAAAVAGSGRWGQMPPVVDDRYPGMVPDGTLTGDDLRATRFKVVPRGYSMTQVDELLARLSHQLDHAPAASTASAVAVDPAPDSEQLPMAAEAPPATHFVPVDDSAPVLGVAEESATVSRPGGASGTPGQ